MTVPGLQGGHFPTGLLSLSAPQVGTYILDPQESPERQKEEFPRGRERLKEGKQARNLSRSGPQPGGWMVLRWEAVLCVLGCVTAFLVHTHERPVENLNRNNQKCLQTLADIPS